MMDTVIRTEAAAAVEAAAAAEAAAARVAAAETVESRATKTALPDTAAGQNKTAYLAAKRAFDIVLSLLLLVLLLPLMLLVVVAIRVDSPGPVIFRQKRIGLHGEEFDISSSAP